MIIKHNEISDYETLEKKESEFTQLKAQECEFFINTDYVQLYIAKHFNSQEGNNFYMFYKMHDQSFEICPYFLPLPILKYRQADYFFYF